LADVQVWKSVDRWQKEGNKINHPNPARKAMPYLQKLFVKHDKPNASLVASLECTEAPPGFYARYESWPFPALQ
jgi:hypothetical protein